MNIKNYRDILLFFHFSGDVKFDLCQKFKIKTENSNLYCSKAENRQKKKKEKWRNFKKMDESGNLKKLTKSEKIGKKIEKMN